DLPLAPAGRLGVAHPDDLPVAVAEAGHAGQGALAAARVVPQPAALDAAPGDPDRQLVADAGRLVPVRLPRGVRHRGAHPRLDLRVRLAPRRPERVPQVLPVLGPPQRAVADAEPHPLEVVPRLDEPRGDLYFGAELRGHRLRGVL